MVLITIVTGAYKPTYNWGAPHCRSQLMKSPYLEPYFEAPIFHGVKLELQSINGPSIYCEDQISIYATADVTQLRSPVYQLTRRVVMAV